MFFTRANSEFLKSRKPPVSGFPLSVSCWFNSPTSIADSLTLWQIGDDLATTQYFRCQVRGGDSGDPVRLAINDGSTDVATTGNGITFGKWHHIFCAIPPGATLMRIMLDGDVSNVGSITQNRTPDAFTAFDIGREGDSTPDDWFNGDIVYMTVWDVEVPLEFGVAMSNHMDPRKVMRDHIVYFDKLKTAGFSEIGDMFMFKDQSGPVESSFPFEIDDFPELIVQAAPAVGGDVRRHIIPAYLGVNS